MSLREWLIAIGTLVIIGIVVDGIRRVRRARKESIAISSGMGADDLAESPLDDEFNPELPNGGARTVSRDTLEKRGYVKREKSSRFGTPEPKPTRPVTESVSQNRGELPDSGFSSAEMDDPEPESGWGATADDLADDERRSGYTESLATGEQETGTVPPDQSVDTFRPEPDTAFGSSDVEEDSARREPANRTEHQPLAGANRPEAREVIVINVLARQGDDFRGKQLKYLFEACGLEFGDMDIYHRHEGADTISPVQFSVANAVEPGTFRPEQMDSLTTPGISFFMSMPGPSDILQAFDFMLETAQCVVRNLGGELKDERRSVMTPQTAEHCRQRIREFERKQRSQRP
jgi:cell division protein ZipA